MRTFLKMTSGSHRRCGRAFDALRERLREVNRRGEDGFLLVEVMMSSVLVALIVVATFNGLDTATKISADQRRHDEAAVLAAQSQEQMRSEPAAALVALETNPHKYTRTIGGTTYTITQGAKAAGKSGEEETTECSVSSTKSETINIQINSSVTWPQLEKVGRPAVKEASVITPPTGSAIEVDVIDGSNAGVSGVTAKATYTPVAAGAQNTIEGTTAGNGCVVLSGIQSTSATVEIVEKIGFVTRAGRLKVPPKLLTIAPNITTHYVVPYAEAGRIAARFTYKGATSWEGKEVVGDTFVAQQAEEFEGEPKYEVGATYFKYEPTGEEEFTPLLGTCSLATLCVPRKTTVPAYEPTAYTAAGSKYPHGDLYPFKEGWRVWAGDCEANATGEGVVTSKPVVGGASPTAVNLPLGYTQLTVYKGTAVGHEGSFEETHLGPVKITNEACESAPTPPNAVTQTFAHEQVETLAKGRLEDPFQPFGTFQLCLVDKALNRIYTVPFTNAKAATPSTPTIYLGQRLTAEVSSEVTTKAAEVKAKEAYKEKSAYVNKASEAVTEKAKYETEKTAYNNDKGKYEAEKAAYTTDLSKYNSEKAAIATDKAKYEAEKTAYTTDLSKYNSEKAAIATDKTKYEAEKTKYTTKKTEYIKKKEEYEKSKKSSQKTEYETLEKEYKTAETNYKKFEAEYKEDETETKRYEGLYKAAEIAYKKSEAEYKEDETETKRYEGLYKAAEIAYKKSEAEYKEDETEYKKYEAAYKLDEQQATEYQYYLEYKAAKAAYEKVRAEQEEFEKSGVTVAVGSKC
jgi:Tfp pilus assembly protein PilV